MLTPAGFTEAAPKPTTPPMGLLSKPSSASLIVNGLLSDGVADSEFFGAAPFFKSSGISILIGLPSVTRLDCSRDLDLSSSGDSRKVGSLIPSFSLSPILKGFFRSPSFSTGFGASLDLSLGVSIITPGSSTIVSGFFAGFLGCPRGVLSFRDGEYSISPVSDSSASTPWFCSSSLKGLAPSRGFDCSLSSNLDSRNFPRGPRGYT
mmetsp:Transcript_21526/g.33998  ORF Transcript_21526/g.33998 Transcript_21526/m.33998 type:complete len:206 (+) Transcript_21526:449-1066(+)